MASTTVPSVDATTFQDRLAELRSAPVQLDLFRVLDRLVSTERHLGKDYQIRSIVQTQARRLVSALRGGTSYRPFRFKW
jgi:CRISPR/Cas system-associated endonuclease Cas1